MQREDSTFGSGGARLVAVGVIVVGLLAWQLVRRSEGLAAEREAEWKRIAEQVDKSKACREAPACKSEGLCGAGADGQCIAVSAKDCANTFKCEREGLCGVRDGECAATADSHCEASLVCETDGRCAMGNGRCMATEASCSQRDACIRQGECHVSEEGECIAKTDADCNDRWECYTFGSCRVRDGRCAAVSDADCLDAYRCHISRLCKAEGGRCVEDAATCAESAACTYAGHCVGEELCSVKDDEMCASAKRCEGKACRALGLPSDKECAESCEVTRGCKLHGRCGEGEDGRCVVRDEADCRRSLHCRTLGACRLKDGICVGDRKR